jgi:iron(III) transport system ATP-binding protein
MNLLPAGVQASDAQALVLAVDGVGLLHLPPRADAQPGTRWLLSFRPHSVQLHPAGTPVHPAGLALAGQVQTREFLGEFTRYRVRVGPHSLAVDQPHHAGLAGFTVGAEVGLALHASQLRLLPG